MKNKKASTQRRKERKDAQRKARRGLILNSLNFHAPPEVVFEGL